MNDKLKKISVCFIITILLLTNNALAINKNNIDFKNFPNEIKNEIINTLNNNEMPLESKIKDGIIMTKEEFEIYKKNLKSKNTITPFSLPKDKYIYIFDMLYITENHKKDYFRYLGEYSVSNQTKSPMTITYRQKNSVTVNWNVASSISGSAKIGNMFLGEIKAKVGASVSRSYTTTSGTILGGSAKCLPGNKLILTAYQGGIYAKAVTVYSKYDKSGGSMGKYTESVSGTVLKNNAFNVKAIEQKIR
ncbi:hypothetical protein [Helcococcus kunzii]|uniref:hypothetical protein n=1 Tax=Helcococcus kunzii TaxID=40091 RepID=UPI0024AD1445|nr:hypothetical protein [Helcococcus kunzii]